MEKEIKIIIADTNLWISLVIKNFNNKFAPLLTSSKIKFISSAELIIEIKETFTKQRLQKHLDQNVITRFWYLFEALVTTIKLTSVVTVCRDPADNYLLSLAKDAGADFLITGDKDLLVLEKFENTIICTLTEFINKYLKQ